MGVKPDQCWCLCTKGCRVLVKSPCAFDVLFLSWALWQQKGQKFNFSLAPQKAKKDFSIGWFPNWTRPLEYNVLYCSWRNSNNFSVHFSKQFLSTLQDLLPQTWLSSNLSAFEIKDVTHLTVDRCWPYYFSCGGDYFSWKLMKFFPKNKVQQQESCMVWCNGDQALPEPRSRSSSHRVYTLEWRMPQCGNSHRSTAGSSGVAVQYRGHGPHSLKSWNHWILGFLCFK